MPNQNQNFSHKITEHLIKLRKIFSLNIGTAIFGVLFLYMIVSAFMYLTSSHIEPIRCLPDRFQGMRLIQDFPCEKKVYVRQIPEDM